MGTYEKLENQARAIKDLEDAKQLLIVLAKRLERPERHLHEFGDRDD